MITWKNLDELSTFSNISKNNDRVDLIKEMSGENGAVRAGNYSVPMAEGLTYNYASKEVNDSVLK